MKNIKCLSACLLASSVLTSLPQIANAQYDDEVIVTATRRAESIQDVPIAVTAVLPEQLERQGVVNIQNLTSVAPSFSTSNAQTSSGTVVLRIRGVGTTSNNIGFESAVGVFIDGAYQSRPGVALGEFIDVERVEVLRGPQGTLFGRNTSAGALNITNVKPDLSEVGGFMNLTYGNYDHASVQAAINIPLAEDKVAARITGAYRKRDGYVDVVDRDGESVGDSNGIDQFMIRGQIGFETNNGTTGRVIVDHSSSDAACCAAIEVMQSGVETSDTFAGLGLGLRGGMFAPNVASDADDNSGMQAAVDDSIATANFAPKPNSSQTGFSVELEHPVSDAADLIYIGSYRNYDAFENYDSDFSGLDVFDLTPSDTNIDTMTHEVRLQGDAMDDRLSWLVGGFYSDEEISQEQNFALGADYGRLIDSLLFAGSLGTYPAGPILTNGTLTTFSGGANPDDVTASNLFTQNSKSWSVFTHNIFDITDKLSATIGLRYSDESKTGGYQQTAVNNDLCTGLLGNLDTATLLTDDDITFDPDGPGGIPSSPVPFGATLLGTGCFAFPAPADHPFSSFLPLPRTFDSKFEDDELIYTGKLGYEFSSDVSAYASFTHGYKSGGFNLDSTAAIPVGGVSDPRFDSEEVDAYELGVKSKLMDGRVTLNVAAFLEEFSNFQVLEFTGAQFVTFNVPKAETKGVEIEFAAQATDSISLNGGLTLLEAKYPNGCDAGKEDIVNIAALCGNTLTNAPKTVGLLGALYEGNLSTNLDFFLSGQLRYEGDRRTSTQAIILPNAAAIAAAGSLGAAIDGATPNPFDVQDSTVKINVRAGIGDADDEWALEAWATNLTNEVTRGVTFNTVLRSGSRSAFVQEPRMYGVTARRNF